MVYRVPASPKQLAKMQSSSSKDSKPDLKPIPKDWPEFAKLCNIRSGDKIVKFHPYEYQILLSDCIDDNFGTVIVKSRQLGITETIANKFLHRACLNPGYVGVFLSKTQADTSNIAKRIRQMADSLKDYIEVETDNLTDLKISNGGRILFKQSTPNGVRGLESVSDICFDECAFIPDIERLYTSAIPSTEMLGSRARIILLSTPNGKSGFFWDRLTSNNGEKDVIRISNLIKSGSLKPIQTWVDSNGWCKFILHWKAHPIYSNIPDYLEQIQTKKQLSMNAVEQEYNLSFDENEVNVFPYELIHKAAIGRYEIAEKGCSYYMGVDTSTVGEDYTVAIVLKADKNKLSVVSLYRERKKTMEYNIARILEMIQEYQPEKIAIEITGGTGSLYQEQLSNLYPSGDYVSIRTTQDTKSALIDRVLLALERESLVFPNGVITEDMLNFRRNGKKLEASSGNHDDCVMSLAFALSVSDFSLKPKRSAVDMMLQGAI